MSDVIETFLNEARDLLEQLEAALLDLETRPDDRELINTTFRALHTLKGSGGMFGPPAMAAFAHELENAFERVRGEAVPMTPALANLLLASTDHLRRLLFEPQAADGAAGARLVAALQSEVAGDAPPPHSNAVPPAANANRDAPRARIYRIRLALPPQSLAFGTDPLGLLRELAELGACTVTARTEAVPALDALKANELHLAWEIVLETQAPRAAIDDVFIFVDGDGASVEEIGAEPAPPPQVEAQAEAPPAPLAQEPSPPAAAPPAPPAKEAPAPVAREAEGKAPDKADASVRVSALRLDTLLDQVGELVIAQARLAALAHQRRDPVLTAVVEEIERLSADLRDSAMDMRMLPIETLFGRYRRVVRDLSADLGKEIDLFLSGEDTELDKTVLDRLGDPLVHIIRNSIDHGIEDAPRRAAAGKPRRGALRLGARQSGTEVVITIADDGAGLDRARILAKAIAAGLVPDGTEIGAGIGEREVNELIFHPGLSTAAAVSNLSGRGVGMDVVKRTIAELHGSIEIASEPGAGTTFTLRLPLTLAIIDGLQVMIGAASCILPLTSVEECVELAALASRTSAGRNFVDIRGTLVPLLWMNEVFGTGRPGSVVVVVGSETGRLGVVVDQVVGQHQTVIKPLSPLHRATPGLAGATILGDGSVALILEVNLLARRAAARAPEPIAA